MHGQLQARWSYRRDRNSPPAYWRQRLEEVAGHAETVQRDLLSLSSEHRLFVELEGLYALQALHGQREHGDAIDDSIEVLFTRLWGNLALLTNLAKEAAGGVGRSTADKVSTHNAELLATCLVQAYIAVFGKVPPYSRGVPFANLAQRAGELLGLEAAGGELAIGTDLLRRAVKASAPPPG